MGIHVVGLEDQPTTIESEIDVIKRYHLEPNIFPRPASLGSFLDDHASDPDAVAAILLDMHVKNVKNLREIRLPEVDPQSGALTGLAVAEEYIRSKNGPYRQTPIGFLTGRAVTQETRQRIERLKKKGGDIYLFEKAKNLSEFEKFIEQICKDTPRRRVATVDIHTDGEA